MASTNTRRKEESTSDDLYSTPEIALEAFYEQYKHVIDQYEVFYDPCDGLGVISDWLESKGKKVYRSDLIDYDRGVETQDFLKLKGIPRDVECIIFNPPFTLTEEFIDKALSFCNNLIMFNRMTTIESNSRSSKFADGTWPLKGMYQFGFRVSCDKGVDREPTANAVAYSWFEFSKKVPVTTPRLHWITK